MVDRERQFGRKWAFNVINIKLLDERDVQRYKIKNHLKY
jgi:hypothetical protein